jgi:type II secretory pathway component PulF
MFFKYTGVVGGKKLSALIESESADKARIFLREEGVMVSSLDETKDKTKRIKPRNKFERTFSGVFIRQGELEQTIRQLVILLKGDVAVVEALDIVKTLCKGMLAQALNEVSEAVKSGSSLGDAMKAQMPFIGNLHLGLIGVGEANGTLPEMFNYCLKLMEQTRAIKNKMIQAMIYPAIVLVMGLGVGYYVSAVAIPKIASVLGGATERLPPITRALLFSSDWIITKGYWLIITPVICVMGIIFLRKFKKSALIIDFAMLKIPLFGKVFSYSANALWNRTLSILMRSGVNVIESLELTQNTMFNCYYRKQFTTVTRMVLGGKALSEGINQSALKKLSPMSAALISVGESAGNIDEGLMYVGEYYEDTLERRLDLLSKLVEPALIVLVGGMVAFVYIAFFMGLAAANSGR